MAMPTFELKLSFEEGTSVYVSLSATADLAHEAGDHESEAKYRRLAERLLPGGDASRFEA